MEIRLRHRKQEMSILKEPRLALICTVWLKQVQIKIASHYCEILFPEI